MAVHRAVNQPAPVVVRAEAAARAQRVRPEARLDKPQELRAEAERLQIAVAAVPTRAAEPMVLLVARVVRAVTARCPRR